MQEPASGLEFPCAFPIKAMVESGPAARAAVLAELARQVRFDPASDVRVRPSRNGRFESITITVQVESRDQLESLYQALRQLDVVKMML